MAVNDIDSINNNLMNSTSPESLSNLKIKPVNDLKKKIEGDKFNEWELVGNSSFTHGFLIQSLRTNDQEFIQNYGNNPVNKIIICDISKGKGFASIVYKATVYFVDESIKPYTTILKVPGTESLNEALEDECNLKMDEELVERLAKSHQFECNFYDNLAKTLKIPVPKVYKTLPRINGKKDGVIHMEDLSRNCKTTDLFNSLSINQIMDITYHLAKMHKNMLIRNDWCGKYLENQTFFCTMCEMIVNSLEQFLELCNNKSFFDHLFTKYRKFIGSSKFVEYAFCQSWKDLELDPVLVHGDLWGGNIMWKVDEYGHPTNKVGAFVDWQIMHEGSIMADLARVITMCTDGDVRRHLEEFIFDFYIDELKKNFEADGLKCPVTLEQIKKAYQFMFLTQVVGLPILAVVQSNSKTGNSEVISAKTDKLILRVKHGYEDVEKLANGDLQWVFDKFNQ